MNRQPPEKLIVHLITRGSCGICRHVEHQLRELHRQTDGFELQVYDLDHDQQPPLGKQTYITPAVWVNDYLWSLGGFDSVRFVLQVQQTLV
jgi:hypothetical protein